jgi:two-component system, chemotaxis family, CheB/CheR fusion protein
MLEDQPLNGLLLIIFEDKGIVKKKAAAALKKDRAKNTAADELEKELIYTKQQLYSTIEQMETSLEELKSTNEELQSTNEELQSTNEESLTTKEEMQSLNEELMTINLQYQTKADELSVLNNDMKNLLDATEIGTIFLDNNLDILRFTPQVKKLFNVIPSDVGRPITHIASNLEYETLEDDIREVIERLTVREIEVKTKLDEWYLVRILPYRTLDNFISGAVLTFTRITPYKQMEYKLEVLNKYSMAVLEMLPQPAILLDNALNIIACNKPFLHDFSLKETEVKRNSFAEIVHKNWKTTALDRLLSQCGKTEMSAAFHLETFKGESKHFELSAIPFRRNLTGEAELILILAKEKDR